MTFHRRRREEQLFKAIETDDDSIARDLLKHGGLDWRNPEWHYSTPMHMCGRRNAWKILKELLKVKADLEMRDKEGMTVFGLACDHQSDDVVHLIQRIRFENPIERQLFELVRNKKLGYVKQLFEKEVPPDVNSVHTESRMTALHIAAERNSLQCLIFLLEQKANPDAVDKTGNTPLHIAVKCQNNDCISYLVGAKASVQAANRWKQTPLHVAAECNNESATRQLLKYSASREAKNSDGLSPLEWARKRNSVAVYDLIVNAESLEKEKQQLFALCATGDIPGLRQLLSRKADIDCVDEQTGSTLLHQAAGSRQILCLVELLKHNINHSIDVVDKKGWTPLHKASIWNCAEEAEYLLDQKASIASLDRKFQTPLHLACQHNSADVVYLLLDSKADLRKQNKKGRTPMDLAKKYDQAETIKVILQAQGIIPLDEEAD